MGAYIDNRQEVVNGFKMQVFQVLLDKLYRIKV